MNTITILPNGSIVDGDIDPTLLDTYLKNFQVIRSERLDTWFDNVAFLGNLEQIEDSSHNESATRLHVPADQRKRAAFYGPVFLVGIENRTPVTLPESVTVEEVERLIALYEDH